MPYSKLLGNEGAKKILSRMVRDEHVPQTLLFAGPEGVGKARFAKAFAGELMGKEHAGKIERGSHPDFHFYRPEGKSQLHPIENMRSLIDEIHLPPFEAPCKFFVIDEAHRMLPSSSNALLKTFEEPAPSSYIILLSSDPDALLPTILSRCCKLAFFMISDAEITQHLIEKMKKSPEEAKQIAFLAQGSLARAEALASKDKESRQPLYKLLLGQRDPFQREEALAAIEASLPKDTEEDEERAAWQREVDLLLEEILYWYRDLHILAQADSSRFLFHDPAILPKNFPLPSLEKITRAIDTCRLSLQHHIKLRTALDNLFLSLQLS